MIYTVFMLEEAEKDLESIFSYILESGNTSSAKNMIEQIRRACESLSQIPERGSIPQELARADISEYRQIIAGPYRIIYEVVEPNVFIFGIIHGSRNVEEVLRQRWLLKD